jgi:hypothetical protein
VPELILGPVLRYVGVHEATVWVETDAPCTVEVLDHREETFTVEGHHYALVCVAGLAPGETHSYHVRLDGHPAWPRTDDDFPPPVIRTLPASRTRFQRTLTKRGASSTPSSRSPMSSKVGRTRAGPTCC